MNVRIRTSTENPAGSPKLRPKATSGEFGAFKQLTRKLVNVPKRELDEKRKRD